MLDLVHTDIYENDELKHWGILGMRWGIRRFQNPDGSLTPEGRERYGVKTAAEVLRPTYNQKYEVLKNKTNRTEEEEKEYQKLEKGRDYILNVYLPAAKDNKPINIKNAEESTAYMQGLEWFLGTNAGKASTSIFSNTINVSNTILSPKFEMDLKNKKTNSSNPKDAPYDVNSSDLGKTGITIIKNLGLGSLDKNGNYQNISSDANGNIKKKDGSNFVYYIGDKKHTAKTLNDVIFAYDFYKESNQKFSVKSA